MKEQINDSKHIRCRGTFAAPALATQIATTAIRNEQANLPMPGNAFQLAK